MVVVGGSCAAERIALGPVRARHAGLAARVRSVEVMARVVYGRTAGN